jgi:phosphate transport system permease protein
MLISRGRRETLAVTIMAALTTGVVLLFAALAFTLLFKTQPILSAVGPLDLLFGDRWSPMRGDFGLLPFLLGTFWVTLTALGIALPFGLFTAIHLSEFADHRVRAFAKPGLDLLAGIPSVVVGAWGVLVIVPFVRDTLAPAVGATTTGYCVLSGGIVLALMVIPLIVSISEEVMRAVPADLRTASLALGATRWQTTRRIVLRAALPGILAAVILGFARAFGETMAVMMVVGNVARAPSSLFDPAYPLPALIANNYGEMMSIPGYDSALMAAALALLVVVAGFSMGSHLVLEKVRRRWAF